MDVWVHVKIKEEECRIEWPVGIGTGQFGDYER